jgi:hypothetical protein
VTTEREWSTPEWRELAVTWLDERLREAGIQRTGPVAQPRIRPWGTVLNAATTAGPVWLMAPGPGTVFEVRLYELLHDVVPDWVLAPIATDAERGWVLLPDGGTSLRDSETDPVEAMLKVLPQYGDLQRQLMPRAGDMVELGVSDMRAELMPERFDEAVAAVSRRADADDLETIRQIVGRRDIFRARCAQAMSTSIGASLDHNDLHAGNVFMTGQRVRFYDWGDSVVSHPFASMLIALRALPYQYGISSGDPAIPRMRDAYLEAFSDLAPHWELVEQLDAACWVGVVARALVWERALTTEDEPGEWTKAPVETLKGLLRDNWLERG